MRQDELLLLLVNGFFVASFKHFQLKWRRTRRRKGFSLSLLFRSIKSFPNTPFSISGVCPPFLLPTPPQKESFPPVDQLEKSPLPLPQCQLFFRTHTHTQSFWCEEEEKEEVIVGCTRVREKGGTFREADSMEEKERKESNALVMGKEEEGGGGGRKKIHGKR